MAKNLEEAAKNGDKDEVENGHQKTMELYKKTVEAISSFLGEPADNTEEVLEFKTEGSRDEEILEFAPEGGDGV